MSTDLRALLVRHGVDPEAVPTRRCGACLYLDDAKSAGFRRYMRAKCQHCSGTGRVPDGTDTLLAALERHVAEREAAVWAEAEGAVREAERGRWDRRVDGRAKLCGDIMRTLAEHFARRARGES